MAKREPFKCYICRQKKERVYKYLNSQKQQVYICYSCVKKMKGDAKKKMTVNEKLKKANELNWIIEYCKKTATSYGDRALNKVKGDYEESVYSRAKEFFENEAYRYEKELEELFKDDNKDNYTLRVYLKDGKLRKFERVCRIERSDDFTPIPNCSCSALHLVYKIYCLQDAKAWTIPVSQVDYIEFGRF